MIGVALIAAVAVIAASFKASGEASIVGSLNSQLLVTDNSSQGGFTTGVVARCTRTRASPTSPRCAPTRW